MAKSKQNLRFKVYILYGMSHMHFLNTLYSKNFTNCLFVTNLKIASLKHDFHAEVIFER